MNAEEVRDRIQRHYDTHYPDSEDDIRIIRRRDGMGALYDFVDHSNTGKLVCTTAAAEAFLATMESDVVERCDMSKLREVFVGDAMRYGFESTLRRRVTWGDVLEFLKNNEKWLDRPALVWLHSPYNGEEDEVGEIVDLIDSFDVLGCHGISVAVDTDPDIDEYIEGGRA